MSWTRKEIDDAFAHYRETAATAAATGEWRPWAELFTDDAEYVEHHYGRFTGRAAIHEWISRTMATPPNDEMNAFPVDWYVVDEDKGWVVCAIWNRMRDPGDGSTHQAVNWTLLKYAGDNRWSYEEDLYNPMEFGEMLKGWFSARRSGDAASTSPSPRSGGSAPA
jgi:hypothetical protein